jgi:hypothetical protein
MKKKGRKKKKEENPETKEIRGSRDHRFVLSGSVVSRVLRQLLILMLFLIDIKLSQSISEIDDVTKWVSRCLIYPRQNAYDWTRQ